MGRVLPDRRSGEPQTQHARMIAPVKQGVVMRA
ncbi:hypothetical protein GGD40_000755 [Paraburkholderia bryophila]|uniref:Uncharacterized protein n=1 Tax=Paraburkholderia bryophila TaxID=420952 RepID=A0A7Z0B4J7_9BURK|nr:hypothetical protein [Paraburkholderia bryophila]